jgi:alpha-L-fucosidase
VHFTQSNLFPAGEPCPSVHAASVTSLPGGRLMASWFGGTREGTPDCAIWGAYFEGGAWSTPHLFVDTPGVADGNSVLWMDDAGQLRLWYVTMEDRGWSTCPVRERRSTDEGRTWGEPRFIHEDWGWMVRNEPIRHAGRLLMPMYDERDWSAFVLASDDGGDTWRESRRLSAPGGIIQPALAATRDERLLMHLRSRGGVIYASRSLDPSGDGWTPPEPTALPNPNSAVELLGLSGGTLLSVFNPSARRRTPLRAALSKDGGAWTQWRDLETADGEFSYPTAIQTADGLIHVLYTHQRRTIAHAAFDEAWLRAG